MSQDEVLSVLRSAPVPLSVREIASALYPDYEISTAYNKVHISLMRAQRYGLVERVENLWRASA